MTDDSPAARASPTAVDVAIAGAGPAGLATAIGAAARGLRVAVFERRGGPLDKACGEGLMPAGLAALGRLGVRPHLDPAETTPLDAIVYVQEHGSRAVGRLPSPGGLGVRRLALSAALRARALELGVRLHERCGVVGHEVSGDAVVVRTEAGPVRAGILVAADGLHSPTRSSAGLAGTPVSGRERFGLRRHVRIESWARAVEVHFGDGVEAYVTPAGAQRVGVAFLWERRAMPAGVHFEILLAMFPALEARLHGADFESSPLGAGPLLQRVRTRTAPRVALVGDAAGYVDAITGEGLSQALEGAEALAAVLPRALARGATVEALAPYDRAAARLFGRYARLAHAVLWVARRPRLRRAVVAALGRHPVAFDWVLGAAIGGQRVVPPLVAHLPAAK